MTLYSSRVALKAANLWQTNAKPGYGDVAHVDGAAYSVISSYRSKYGRGSKNKDMGGLLQKDGLDILLYYSGQGEAQVLEPSRLQHTPLRVIRYIHNPLDDLFFHVYWDCGLYQIEGRWKALSARHSQSFYYKLVRQPNQAPLTPQKMAFPVDSIPQHNSFQATETTYRDYLHCDLSAPIEMHRPSQADGTQLDLCDVCGMAADGRSVLECTTCQPIGTFACHECVDIDEDKWLALSVDLHHWRCNACRLSGKMPDSGFVYSSAGAHACINTEEDLPAAVASQQDTAQTSGQPPQQSLQADEVLEASDDPKQFQPEERSTKCTDSSDDEVDPVTDSLSGGQRALKLRACNTAPLRVKQEPTIASLADGSEPFRACQPPATIITAAIQQSGQYALPSRDRSLIRKTASVAADTPSQRHGSKICPRARDQLEDAQIATPPQKHRRLMPGAESPLLTDSPKVNCDRPSEQASAPFTLSSPVSLAAASPATGPSGMQTSSPGLTPEPVLDARSRMLSEPKAIADLGASTALPTSNAFRLGASSFATKACGIHRQGAQAYASQSAGPSALHKCGTYPEACHAPSSAADAEDKQPQQLHHGTITISALVSLANRELEDDHITSGQMEGLQEVVGDMQTLLSVHMDKVNSVLCQDGKLVGMQVVVTRRLLRDLRQRSVNMSTDAC